MHSRKKLQEKETSTPIPKKYLEYEVSQRAYVLRLGEERCFYVNHSGVVKESLAKIRKGLSQKKKREKCLKIGLNPGSTHPPGSQLSYLPW